MFNPSKIALILSAFGSFVGGTVLIKELLGDGTYKGDEKLTGKTVIVTGSNTGIGKVTALELAKRDAQVILACRNMVKCEEARKAIVLETANKKVFCEECNLASLKSVRKCAEDVIKSYSRVDILINNAGVMRCKKSVTTDGFEMQFGTNHLGHFLLTVLLLDKLKASVPSRIINLTSVAHERGKINFEDLNGDQNYDPGDAYNQSKLANILFTVELAEKLKGTGVTCNAVHPGIVNTEITRHLSFATSWLAAIFVRPFTWLFIKTPFKGAQTTLYAALSPNLENVTGKYFSNRKESDPSEASQDKEAAHRLWAISERWTGIS